MFKNFVYLVFLMALVYGVLVFYPGMFFKNKYDYKNFTIYSHETINGDIDSTLEKAHEKIILSEFFKPDLRFNFYIMKSDGEYSFFTLFGSRPFAYTYPLKGNIFIASVDFEKKRAKCKNCQKKDSRDLEIIIAREAAHEMTRSKLGFLKYIVLQDWKNEGYAEHIAGETGYFEPDEICDKSKAGDSRLNLFRNKLAVEILMNDENYSFAEIIDKNLSYESVKKRIERRHCR